jgi:hypothetical protein
LVPLRRFSASSRAAPFFSVLAYFMACSFHLFMRLRETSVWSNLTIRQVRQYATDLQPLRTGSVRYPT